MFLTGSDPVQPISLGSALQISLDNFYDLLKTNAGVAQNELLQLRLAADLLDISDDIPASKKGYVWFTYGNLVDRCDRRIEPSPVSPQTNGAQVDAAHLSDIYGQFMRKLRTLVVKKDLSPEDEKKHADIDGLIQQDKIRHQKLVDDDQLRWSEYCKSRGLPPGDQNAYLSWSATWGNLAEIKSTYDDLVSLYFDLKTLLDKKIPDPVDAAIVQAEWDYNNMAMKASYPILPDSEYPNGDEFNINYLIQLGQGGSGAFNWRYVLGFDQTLPTIRTTGGGHFDASWDRTTGNSTSIESDWSGSASGSYYFISVHTSASEHTKIQDDFTHTTGVELKCEAAFRINVKYPQWFHAELFEHQHVKDNPHLFEEFFGTTGSLLYYPLAIVVVRGFSASFSSAQNWEYDYDHTFSASGGGGFGVGPICFNVGGNYNNHVHEHKIDQQNTSLTISDDKNTIRFVGYVLAKNSVFSASIKTLVAKARIE